VAVPTPIVVVTDCVAVTVPVAICLQTNEIFFLFQSCTGPGVRIARAASHNLCWICH
jgi:hypothetical protein